MTLCKLKVNVFTLSVAKCWTINEVPLGTKILYWLVGPVTHLRDSGTQVWISGGIIINHWESWRTQKILWLFVNHISYIDYPIAAHMCMSWETSVLRDRAMIRASLSILELKNVNRLFLYNLITSRMVKDCQVKHRHRPSLTSYWELEWRFLGTDRQPIVIWCRIEWFTKQTFPSCYSCFRIAKVLWNVNLATKYGKLDYYTGVLCIKYTFLEGFCCLSVCIFNFRRHSTITG